MRSIYDLFTPSWERPAWVRLLIVAAALGLAFLLRLLLEPWVGHATPFLAFLPALMLCSWEAGARAGVAATLVCTIIAGFFFMPPAGELSLASRHLVVLAIFFAEGLVISFVGGLARHAFIRLGEARLSATLELEKMADCAPGFVWSVRADGSTAFVNRCWLDFTGTHAFEALADRLKSVHPDDRPRLLAEMRRAREENRPYQLEYRLRRADGVHRWILEHAVPRLDDAGAFAGFIGCGIDIEASRREREELIFVDELHRALAFSMDFDKAAESVSRALVPIVADWCCIRMLDETGAKLRTVSLHHADPARVREALRFDHTADPFGAGSSHGIAAILNDGQPRLVERVDDAFLRETAVTPGHLAYLRAQKFVSYIGIPLRVRGRVIGVLSLATADSGRVLGADKLQLAQKIGGIVAFALENARLYQSMGRALAAESEARREREQSETALENQRMLLKTIIDAVPAMVAYIDTGERFLLHNRRYEEWLGLSYDEIHGKTVRDLVGEIRYPEVAPHLHSALAGNPVRYEKTIYAPHQNRDAMVTYRPDIDASGRVVGVVIHAFDITESRQMAIAVARSEKRYRTLITASAAIVWSASASGRVTEAIGLERFTGRPISGDHTDAWQELIHPDDRERVLAKWLRACREGGFCDQVYRLLAADGRYHHVHSRAASVLDANGEIEEWIGTVTDINQRVEAEESLRRKEVELQLVVDAMPALVSYVDSDLRYVFANQAYQKWFGIDPSTLPGAHLSDLLGPEVYERILPRLRRVLAGEEVRYEDHLPYVHGGARWVNATLTPRFGDGGAVVGYFALLIDITERKQTERRIADLFERYRFLADAMPQNVWTANAAGEQDYVNRRWVEYTGMDFADGAGNRWLETIHPDDLPTTTTRWQEALSTGGRYEVEHRLRDRFGNYHWFLSLALARRDESGRIVQWVGSSTNIDPQRRAYAQLAEARLALRRRADSLEDEVRQRTARLQEVNAELEAFTYSASHDLRAPLRHIHGFTDAVLSDAANTLTPESLSNLHLVEAAANRMDKLIADLLAYSRVSRAEIVLAPLSLDTAVADVLADHRATLAEKAASVDVRGPLPSVLADVTGLHQVLSNLVGNALKFVPAGRSPALVVRAENRRKRVRLWIEDNGIGIDPRYHDDIFVLFRRLHGAKTYPGTGVGLSLVKKGMARMGGECGVESAPGEGSRFWLDFQPAPDSPQG